MNFSQIYGNEDVKSALIHMVKSGKVPHAMLFEDKDGGQAFALIQAFVQYLNCENRHGDESCGKCAGCRHIEQFTHSDISYIYPITTSSKVSGKASDIVSDDFYSHFKELVIDNFYFLENTLSTALGIEKKVAIISANESRNIIKKLTIAPLSSKYRIFVILYPEKMNQSAANILLKELEEPRENIIFIMLSHSVDEILPTIRSRCLDLFVRPNSNEEICSTLVEQFSKKQEDISGLLNILNVSIGKVLDKLSENELETLFYTYFSKIMSAIISRNFLEILNIADNLSQMDSREKQRSFCLYLSERVRDILLINKGLGNLVSCSNEQQEYYNSLVLKIKESFCSRTMLSLDRASMLLERNVNQRIVFCTLLSRMFYSI